jgi:tetratricopeptide (TPR) repeat protein
MTDVFISYSRKDKEFVSILYAAFERSQKNSWVDWDKILPTADWWKEIEKGIEGADTFVFVISPDSIASEFCQKEIFHAVQNNKRLFPIVRRDATNFEKGNLAHDKISERNWLWFREQDDFEKSFKTLTEALLLDLEHLHSHTRLLVRAIDWGNKGRSDSLLLRGDDLANAELWLGESEGKDPQPTELQETYIKNSRDVENASDRAAAILRIALEKATRTKKHSLIGLTVTLVITILAIGIASVLAYRSISEAREVKKSILKSVWKFRQSELLRQEKRLNYALKIVDQNIKNNPNDDLALIGRGFIYTDMERYTDAETDFREAIKLNIQSPQAYNGLGNALFLQNKLDEAINSYYKALEIENGDIFTYISLGRVLVNQNKLDEGINFYYKALQIDSENASIHYHLGIALRRQNKLDEAINAYIKSIEIDPKYAIAYNSLGNVFTQQNKLDEAIAAYREAIEINPKYFYPYNGICWASTLAGQAKNILSSCDKAIELAPDSSRDFHRGSRGLARAVSGNIEGAIEDFEAFLKWLDTNNLTDANFSKPQVIAERQQWIKELREGKLPSEVFTQEVLERLRNQ